jgi:hypothetical protein
MVFFPHGMDQMFWYPHGRIIPDRWFNSIVADGLIGSLSRGEELYLKRFGEIYTNVFRIETLTNRIVELATLLGPHAGTNYDAHVKRIRDLIVARHTYLSKRLREPPPQPLVFSNGVAKLRNWESYSISSELTNVTKEMVTADGRKTLYLLAVTNGSAAWSTTVLLNRGRFRFHALAKVKGVTYSANRDDGVVAGIRHETDEPGRISKIKQRFIMGTTNL